MSYKLCIDSGGTKISLAVYYEGSLFDQERIYFDGNLLSDYEKISDKYVELISKYHDLDSLEVLIGAAGAVTIGEVKCLELENKVCEIANVSKCNVIADVFLSALSNFKYNDGLLFVMGTGSAFVKKCGLNFDIIGGYGYLLGDFGSGYHYGKLLLREYLGLKERGVNNELVSRIEQFYECDSEREIIKLVMADARYEISRLCEVFIDERCASFVTLTFLRDLISLIREKMSLTGLSMVMLDGSLTKSVEVRKVCSGYDFINIADRLMTEAVLYYDFRGE